MEVEIEFKNMLTKKQYEALLRHFQINSSMIFRQTNHYFDTPNEHLKNLSCGLRIRQIGDRFFCTLKEKNSTNIHTETTDELSNATAQLMLTKQGFYAETVKQRLQQLQVPIKELQIIASITTYRVELPYKEGTLVLDRSLYLNFEDYEVEYETNNETLGEQIFEQFLADFNIKKQVSDKKIARYMNALQKKEG